MDKETEDELILGVHSALVAIALTRMKLLAKIFEVGNGRKPNQIEISSIIRESFDAAVDLLPEGSQFRGKLESYRDRTIDSLPSTQGQDWN